MTTLEIWLLAVSLAIDCFTVSVTSGIILRRIQWRTFLKMAFFFGFFQALMPLIGWSGANHFSHLIEAYDHWIAFGLLAFLGIRMIREYFKDIEECSFDPTRLKVILTLAVATSIDALAVGISFAFTGYKHFVSAACYRLRIVRHITDGQPHRYLLRETFQFPHGVFWRTGFDWHRNQNTDRTSFLESINIRLWQTIN